MTVAAETVTSVGAEFEDVKRLEEAFLRVPIEQARRVFRSEIKLADKDIPTIIGAIRNLPRENIDLERRRKLVEKLQSISTKLQELKAKRKTFMSRVELRANELLDEELASLSTEGGDHPHLLQWQRRKMVRMVAEYLLLNNYFYAAQMLLTVSSGASPGHVASTEVSPHSSYLLEGGDWELYEEGRIVTTALLNRSTTEGLAWCAENRALLKKKSSPLEFLLRRQEFVELVRRRDFIAAIQYARKHFPAYLAEEYGPEVEQALALLAIPPFTSTLPYCWLYDERRWDDLCLLFRLELRSLYGLPRRSQLESILFCGMASLKSRRCVIPSSSPTSKEPCPVCTGPLAILCDRLPFSHHETSSLVCPISGLIMDNSTVPLATPDGMVISPDVVATLRSEDRIVMPNQQTYKVQELRKCFIS